MNYEKLYFLNALRYVIWKWFVLQYPDSKVHGANMGPTWDLSAPDGPRDDLMNLSTCLNVLNNGMRTDTPSCLMISLLLRGHDLQEGFRHVICNRLINALEPDRNRDHHWKMHCSGTLKYFVLLFKFYWHMFLPYSITITWHWHWQWFTFSLRRAIIRANDGEIHDAMWRH